MITILYVLLMIIILTIGIKFYQGCYKVPPSMLNPHSTPTFYHTQEKIWNW